MKRGIPKYFLMCVLMLAMLLVGCGGGGSNSGPGPNPISVSITPGTASLLVRAGVKFTTAVTGSSNQGVTFQVLEANGGQITASGDYLAPAAPGTFHVRATSVADTSKSAVATMTIRDYSNQMKAAPNPAYARDFHTVSLLADGSVLVIGGRGIVQAGVVRQAERYVASSDSFSNAGALNVARMEHAAVVLPSGKVLVSGGKDFSAMTDFDPAFKHSELYDPTTSAFTTAPDMNAPRRRHVFTLLKDGRVLVTGGIQLWGEGFGASPSAELYDPGANQFALTGSMTTGRWLHTATLLNDGRVLVVGGRDNNCPYACPIYALASAEIFDPATGTFTPTGSLHLSRWGHTATLLPDGRVLILGGETTEDIGGTDQIATGEVWDPATGQFTTFGTMVSPRSLHTITLLNNGKYLIAGGYNVNGAPSFTTELFDAGTGTSQTGPNMNDYRIRHTATKLLSGEVLIVGGNNSGQAVWPVDIYR